MPRAIRPATRNCDAYGTLLASTGTPHRPFVAFTAAPGNAVGIPVTPGAYSVAVQFVNTATGETSGYQVLGTSMVALALEDGGADEAPAAKKKAA